MLAVGMWAADFPSHWGLKKLAVVSSGWGEMTEREVVQGSGLRHLLVSDKWLLKQEAGQMGFFKLFLHSYVCSVLANLPSFHSTEKAHLLLRQLHL